MQTNRVISDKGLKGTPNGFQVDIRLPWYRSLPLSTVEVGEISLDGKPVELSKVHFELEGKAYPLSAMPDLVDTVWYVLDSAFLKVDAPAMRSGSQHEVSVTLNLYPPYIRGLKRVARESKTLQAL